MNMKISKTLKMASIREIFAFTLFNGWIGNTLKTASIRGILAFSLFNGWQLEKTIEKVQQDEKSYKPFQGYVRKINE